MDAKTAKHIGKIEIPNVRYIRFHDGKAYASSYVAPVKFDQNARVGYVAEIDTTTLQVTRTVNVGYQPEELAIANNKVYVANSGGYMFPNYDRTVSVIDLETFKEVKKLTWPLTCIEYGQRHTTSSWSAAGAITTTNLRNSTLSIWKQRKSSVR